MEEVEAADADDPEQLLRQSISTAIRAHGSLKEISYRAGIPRGTLEKYAAETSTPSLFNAAKIASCLGVSLDDLAGLALAKSGGPDSHDLVPLPFYEDVQASAGAGLSAPSWPRAESAVAFDQGFLRDKGATPDRCTVIKARGDSMSPTIPDGSLLVVDHSQTQVSNGFIMVISLGDDLLVKRIRRRLDGLIDLISDNQAYAPETLGPDMLQQLRVVGRVVYFCRAP